MRRKVIIVDDDAAVRRLFEAAFSSTFLLLAASGGQAGLELIKKEKPDLVFLDIDMPDVSGLDVLRLLKESGLAAVVWMLTGQEKLEVITEAIGLGASGYITKPFEIGKIREILNSALLPEEGMRSAKAWQVKKNLNA